MLIDIDEARCSGCGQCVVEAPDIFDQRDDDGVAILIRSARPEDHGDVKRASAACPADAIILSDG